MDSLSSLVMLRFERSIISDSNKPSSFIWIILSKYTVPLGGFQYEFDFSFNFEVFLKDLYLVPLPFGYLGLVCQNGVVNDGIYLDLV